MLPLHSLFSSSSLLPSSSSPSPSPSIPFSLFSKPTTKTLPFKTITSCTQDSKPTTTTSSSSSNGDNNLNLVKAPTPPWMTSPLLLPPDQLLNLSQPKSKPQPNPHKKTHESLALPVRGGRNRQAMKRIVQSISKLREIEKEVGKGGEEKDAPEYSGNVPWVRAEEKVVVFRREKKERVVTAAEMVVPVEKLGRLRTEARGMRRWVKAKKAGVTQEVVDEIVKRWREEELVMVKFVDPLRRNLDRAREILEIKTSGLVVWSKKDTLVIYRGNDWSGKKSVKDIEGCSEIMGMDRGLHAGPGTVSESLYEREANRLLDDLGPRFIDWWWRKPLPVDADLLAEVVPNFRPPFRLCLPRERSKLKDNELTYLRKLALPLPTHFALGKNRKLQGLAAAIIKLWEKSVIAKIAVKVGIQNTDNEQMAEELKLKLKIEKSEGELAKLSSSWGPSEQFGDQELLTEEERQSFRRIGLKMDEFLLLGRRGVFDGTIESINQHWKHQEVVKVITMQKAFHQIIYTAKLLEIESGGVLVAVEKLKSGHAIIIYRGKNYDRMLKPSPENLLTKREALQRSIEIQRRGSMKYFAWQKQRTISELKQRLRNLERKSKEPDTDRCSRSDIKV